MDADELFGGGGNDTISAADGSEDYVDCGTGTEDTASVDETDIVNENCENATPTDTTAAPTTSTATATASATAPATAAATTPAATTPPAASQPQP